MSDVEDVSEFDKSNDEHIDEGAQNEYRNIDSALNNALGEYYDFCRRRIAVLESKERSKTEELEYRIEQSVIGVWYRSDEDDSLYTMNQLTFFFQRPQEALQAYDYILQGLEQLAL